MMQKSVGKYNKIDIFPFLSLDIVQRLRFMAFKTTLKSKTSTLKKSESDERMYQDASTLIAPKK